MPAPRVLVVAPAARARASRLLDAARHRGLVLGSPTTPGRKHYHGGPRFADHAADALAVGLLEPGEAWLPDLAEVFTRRAIRVTTLAQACASPGPVFVKPPTTKDFPAAVHADGRALAASTAHVPGDTAAQVGEVVEFAAEFRLFVLDGTVHTGSRYATWGRLDPRPLGDDPDSGRVRAFADTLFAEVGDTLPSAVVVDVGLLGPPEDPRRHVAVVDGQHGLVRPALPLRRRPRARRGAAGGGARGRGAARGPALRPASGSCRCRTPAVVSPRLLGAEGDAAVDFEFGGELWFWRGPAPWYFVTVPEEECAVIQDEAPGVTYGWGMIPVVARIGDSEWKTSLWPKGGRYIVPVKAAVRRAEELEVGDTPTVRLTIGG